MINLKPCPCCGHRAELRDTNFNQWLAWSITCFSCGLTIEGGDKEEVIETWQRRRTDGMIAWLNAEIEFLDGVQNALNRQAAFKDCKKQLLKLLNGTGVKE